MHDIYYEDLETDWPAINVDAFLLDIHNLIRPGGIFGVIDHTAIAGTEAAVVGKSLHRIDPAIIIRDLQTAGFTLIDAADILKNPADDLTKLVFLPELRWQSDRSVLLGRR